MSIPNATRLATATAASGLGSWVSLHTAAGGTTGASEASGGSYARKQTTWSDSASVNRAGTQVNIPCAAGTYVEAGLWSAVTAGTFVGSGAFASGNVVVSGTGASIDVTMTWNG